MLLLGCKPAASPVSVGDKPVSINDRAMKDAPRRAMKPVGELNWTTFNGNVQKIKDFEGKVLVLDFWATYCPPCIKAIPHLLEIQEKYKDDLLVFGLHVGGKEDEPEVPKFVEQLSITYTLATPEDELSRYIFGDESEIPQTAIFGRDGKLIKRLVGFDDEIKVELDKIIEEAVNAGK